MSRSRIAAYSFQSALNGQARLQGMADWQTVLFREEEIPWIHDQDYHDGHDHTADDVRYL